MKYLLPLLLSFNLYAGEVYIKRLPYTERLGSGYMYAYESGGVMRCWGMGDVVDLAFVPETWMTVNQAAVTFNWPTPTSEIVTACQDMPRVYRTMGGPIWTITPNLAVQQIGTIPQGIPCGDQSGELVFVRAVTHGSITGSAICYLM